MPGKKILIIGGGGREHALAWGMARSTSVEKIYAAPGSDGMAEIAECIQIDPNQLEKLADWAERSSIDLTVVGPEAYLEKGIVDTFQSRGLVIFGPTRAAAQLEWSKVFAKEFMARHHIPTAAFEVFDQAEAAEDYLHHSSGPWVIKADGLAAGKGVVVADTIDEAIAAVREMMLAKKFGAAGGRIVIEEKLEGDELSLLAIADGERLRPLLPAQDHKRVGDGDTGPNTGGMGAYSPTVLLTPELAHQIYEEILEPTIRGMKAEGTPFKGVLYAGLMLTKDGPKVIEYNVRFGDPETQAIIPLLESDLVELFMAAVKGELDRFEALRWRQAYAACVVIASGGYPGSYEKGCPIFGLDGKDPHTIIFHAGTRRQNDQWVNDGGRVLNVVGIGKTIKDALNFAYNKVNQISFSGSQFRKDIGWRELRRQNN
jgi:phosphoribosylamine--glycine ligase